MVSSLRQSIFGKIFHRRFADNFFENTKTFAASDAGAFRDLFQQIVVNRHNLVSHKDSSLLINFKWIWDDSYINTDNSACTK